MPSPLEVYFLDVGPTKYGDSILIRHGRKTILIDGGHPGDLQGSEGYPSIPDQLDAILGEQRPHNLSMLVVTHAHNDHIGCLPEMVANGVISAERAYVADVALGWGTQGDALPAAALDAASANVLAMLREEGGDAAFRSAASDPGFADLGKLKDRYEAMIAKLRENGAEIISCTGTEDRSEIETAFRSIGLKILGPTQNHLELCATQIASEGRDALAALGKARAGDATLTGADLLRRTVDALDESLADRFGTGSALNCQSIVMSLQFKGKHVLLAGDMQFAKTEVTGLDDEMTALREVISHDGPYHVIKTTHHTSYNGVDEGVIDEQVPQDAPFFMVHTGGVNDSGHPDAGALSTLRSLHRKRDDFTWLRVDRNGQVGFTIGDDGAISFTKAKGRINVFAQNQDAAVEPVAAIVNPVPPPQALARVEEQRPAKAQREEIEVIARVPHTRTRVTITINVKPGASGGGTGENPAPPRNDPAGNDTPIQFRLPSDRQLPNLLFVTDKQALGRKIGQGHADALVTAITNGGKQIISDQPLAGLSALQASAIVRPYLNGKDGVVIVGGQDVVPSLKLDVLSPDLRARIPEAANEPDAFIVWSDDIYGDTDGDHMEELPVSRLSDGGSAAALAKALSASVNGNATRFGVRNIARPFAEQVFQALPGASPMRSSSPLRSTDLRPRDVLADFAYFMLHGDDGDAKNFWGENNGSILTAFDVDRVPQQFAGVVFAGCCWGALTTTRRAIHFAPGEQVTCKTSRDSIALRFLSAGARAFVGCTGVHYSPAGNQPNNNGGPMHMAFFAHLLANEPPARALFLAKQDCLRALPPNMDGGDLAISLKIIRQFTCLGLGW